MMLTQNWITHSPERAPSVTKHEANCSCGIAERHRHCTCCGYLFTVGDWDATSSVFNFQTHKFEKHP